jgi:uncharacterized membrane protein
MAEHLEPDPAVPPPAELIHLPEPSYLPIVLAFGIMVALVGVLLSLVLKIIGLIIILVALIRWIRSAREQMSELPLEHH